MAHAIALLAADRRPGAMRFGLGDGSEHAVEEVGQSFAVTRERIRQIEAKALRPCGIRRPRGS